MDSSSSQTPPSNAAELSPAWQSNIQAIQNLMGAVSDLDDAVLPLLPYITHRSPYTAAIFALAVGSAIALVMVLDYLPLRLLALVVGLSVFTSTHPIMRERILPVVIPPLFGDKTLRSSIVRARDNSNLEDKHWMSEMREVELFQNERWSPTLATDGTAVAGKGEGGSWSKMHLKPGERSGWTRGRDGWSGVGDGDVRSVFHHLSVY